MSQPGKDKMWGGRFEAGPDSSFYEFQRSWRFDRRLLPYELALDRAWAKGLERAALLTSDERAQILGALDGIERRSKSDPAW
ncbi:MAG: hypothetical protein WA002_15925, partial [Candidatus Acidiferrales bacterium]